MNRVLNLKFRKGDLLAILLVIVLAAVVGVGLLTQKPASQEAVVQIYQDGELVRELSLQANEIIEITGRYCNTIHICDGKVAIIESDCPGEDCVHSGWISTPGRSIVCLPNRLEIRIVGKGDVDFVVG